MTAQEAIRNALDSLALVTQHPDRDYSDDGIELSTTLPFAQMVRHGFTVETLDENDADVLPRMLVQSDKGRTEIERCPFAPLALLSGDDGGSVAEVADVLQQAGFTALTLDDFRSTPDWHGLAAVSWLFPERLSEALSLFDILREHAGP